MFRRRLGIEDRPRWWRGVVSRLATLTVAALALDGADVVRAKPAGDLHDLQDVFAGCFHPPREAADTRVTFYFSLNSVNPGLASPPAPHVQFRRFRQPLLIPFRRFYPDRRVGAGH